MKILRVDLKDPEREGLKDAAALLKRGGLVVYPTDTAYGLGVNALDGQAVRELYAVKEREAGKPTHVVVRDLKMIEDLVYLNEVGRRIIKKFLPGPLTLVFKKREGVPSVLVGGFPTLGIRIPDCEITKALSKMVDFPYTTPSANPAGGYAPYSLEEVLSQFGKEDFEKIDLFLDAGTLLKTPPSTIIDLSGGSLRVLRDGQVSAEEVKRALEQV